MKSAFVTGGSGFIGYHLVRRLRKSGVAVRCLVRKTSCRTFLDELGVEFIEGDITDLSALQKGANGVDVVFHLAGVTQGFRTSDYFDVNQIGCRNITGAIRANSDAGIPTPTLVTVSSLAASGAGILRDRKDREVYGSKFRPRVETDLPFPVSPYGKSKLAGEKELVAASDRIPITILRPAIVFGEKDNLCFPLFQMVHKTPFFLLPGYVNRPFAFIYVGNLVTLLIEAALHGERLTPESLTPISETSAGTDLPPQSNASEKEVSPEKRCSGKGIYFVASPEKMLFSQFGKMLSLAVGRRHVLILRCPPIGLLITGMVEECYKRLFHRHVAIDLDKARESLGGPWICSSGKAEEQLGFSPAESFQEELNRTARWYEVNGWFDGRKGHPKKKQ